MTYNPQSVQSYFDHYGEREWERLESTLQGRIKYAIHRRFLDAYIPDGARVADVGCGPGRYALDLAGRGCRLTLVDLSPVQLEAARQHFASASALPDAANLLKHVEAFHCLDMLDLHLLPEAGFEVVVCYGAALCYTYDRYPQALQELVRLLKPGGRLLISVDSLYGTLRLIGPFDALSFIESPDTHLDWQSVLLKRETYQDPGIAISRPGSPEFHQPLVLFSSIGLKRTLEQAGLRVIEMASANPLVADGNQMPKVTSIPQACQNLLELELAVCNQPGLLDAGEHMIAVAEKSRKDK